LFGVAHDRRGSLATFIAASIVPLVAFGGLAVDTGRGYLMKSRLSYALDAAGLAAGRVMYDETLRDEMAQKFFAANFPDNYMNASVSGPTVIYDDTANTIQLDAVATMGTSLMSVLGLANMNVAGSSTVKLSSVNIEVAVVLDVTGSMSGQKIEDLKTAAKDLVDIIVQDQQEPHYSKVALVPYSVGVNVGSYADQIRGPAGAKNITNATRTDPVVITAPNHGFANGDKVFIADVNGMYQVNSVESETHYTVANKTTDTFQLRDATNSYDIDGDSFNSYTSGGTVGKVCTTPGCEYFRFEPDDDDEIPWSGNGKRIHRTSTCVSERTGTHAYDDVAPSTAYVAHNYTNYPYSLLEPWHSGYNNPCLDNEIVPLTSDKVLLTEKIDEFSATGSTAGQIGVAWGWYMVSPNFGYLWPADSQPAAYGEEELQKAVVIMTDGEFNTIYADGVIAQNSGSGSGGRDYKINKNGDNGADAFQQAQQLCSAMKANQIEVYTIGFDIGGSTTIENFLNDCATDIEHAFIAEDGDQLKQVFRAIALNISRLRLAK
jgi:Flp pilus assembly protein TadG